MPHRHRNDADSVGTRRPCGLTAQDITHMRTLAYESLTRESAYLHQHAQDAWMGDPALHCGEDAETTSRHVRKTFDVLDHLGWKA